MVVFDMEESSSSLEEQALKRKERLNKLKRKIADNETSNQDSKEKIVLPKPKFRSYRPQDEALQESVVPDTVPADVEEEVKDLLDAANEKVVLEDLDISSLAPRKPDWDLKRDVLKKLEMLERQTQKAIAELIWERLREGTNDNLNLMLTVAENEAVNGD